MTKRVKKHSVGARFYGALGLLVLIGILGFGVFVARRADDEVRRQSSEILHEARASMEQELDRMAATQEGLLDQSVDELSERFGRELEDIPFDLYRDRQDLLRELLVERLGEMRVRNRENASLIAEIAREREGARIDAAVNDLERRHKAAFDRFRKRVTRTLLILGGAFLLGVAAIIGLVFHWQVLRPLRRTTAVIDAMGKGVRGHRLEAESSEEMQRLVESVNVMAEAVESSQSDLEARVSEKTAALSDALDEQRLTNAELSAATEELEQAQGRLVQTAKMAALGTMAQGMAHEFNNVLGGIAGCADDLRSDESDLARREVLDVILRTAQRATVITRNLKSFSRGEEGVLAECDLGALAREAALLVEPEAKKRGVTLTVDCGPLPAWVRSDPRALQQVLLNLYYNAIQASPTGETVRVTLHEADALWKLEVIDQGVGIPAANLDRLFEPFFTTKSQEGGTGLGLAVSHGIVANLGGEITVSSQGEGQGATVTLELSREGGSS